ncbi:MAG TPA: DinB family protein [Thermoanaerobaculia bacterium]|nr:DinB family protein [Thermoanaerobaculia bacterium]
MDVLSVGPFLDYWEKVHGRTRRVAECIPADRVEWTPQPGKFTLGDTVRHLAAIERWMYAENAARRPSRYPGHGRELADGREAVLGFFETCHAGAAAIVGGLADADLKEKCVTPAGAALSVGKWLRLMVEHEIHHRGQLYLSLGLLGVSTPPIYGLTSEEVRERSLPGPAAPG